MEESLDLPSNQNQYIQRNNGTIRRRPDRNTRATGEHKNDGTVAYEKGLEIREKDARVIKKELIEDGLHNRADNYGLDNLPPADRGPKADWSSLANLQNQNNPTPTPEPSPRPNLTKRELKIEADERKIRHFGRR